ncbi:predicted protein [Uncinocarpus reesii 1704]|uniref:GPI anchored protein n=1 Tax=Uncinocarpus reesii (strain UAMH 1704) TaxID=336963 RepID=C4JTU9_UNCRE|nr:uncharacterized protein UREG_05888 [Uncinocarpus reesii 1704]EEP81046.1 predicted protein [Uncinocarpus reesii 1704]
MRFSLISSVLALSAVALAQTTSGEDSQTISLDDPVLPSTGSVAVPSETPADPATDTGSASILPVPPTVTISTDGPIGTAPGGTGSSSMPGNGTSTFQTETESRTVSAPTGTATTTSSEGFAAPTNGPQAVGLGLGLGALIAAFL